MTERPHRLWCNCSQCVHWRGTIIPEWRVARLEAQLREAETRPDPLIHYGFDLASGPDQAVIIPAAQQIQEDLARATGVPWWEAHLDERDLRFLKSIGINPWK